MGRGGKSESGYRGVYRVKDRWVVQFRSCGVNESHGSYKTKDEAIRVAKMRWKELFGSNTTDLNEIAPITKEEQADLDSMEYPIPPHKLIAACMREAT